MKIKQTGLLYYEQWSHIHTHTFSSNYIYDLLADSNKYFQLFVHNKINKFFS